MSTASGTTTALPAALLLSPSESESPPCLPEDIRELTCTTLSQLETALLDIDTRVDRRQRPHGNAWKQITVWRYAHGRQQELDAQIVGMLEKGGRECYGTLFYLRGCFSHER